MAVLPEIVRRQVEGHSGPVEVEVFLVKHSFDFELECVDVGGRLYYVIGCTDVDVPLALSHDTGGLYCLGDGAEFINSSLGQFIECVNKFKSMDELCDEELENDKRVALFEVAMKIIDEECFRNRNSFWSCVREEMVYGVI